MTSSSGPPATLPVHPAGGPPFRLVLALRGAPVCANHKCADHPDCPGTMHPSALARAAECEKCALSCISAVIREAARPC
jgi:hypothetical protein